MTMENTCRIRHKWNWKDHNVTIAAYVPIETYEKLVRLAEERTAASGKWYSLSRLIREIVEEAVQNN